MPQRYERIQSNVDDDDHYSNASSPTSSTSINANATSQRQPHALAGGIPASPPPSFHSRASSPTATSHRRENQRLLSNEDPLHDHDHDNAARDRELADAFDESDSDDEDAVDDRQRLMRGQPESAAVEESSRPGGVQRRVTELPAFVPAQGGAVARSGKVYGGGQNDGVWANLSAKPTRGEEVEEKPPSYEQAAADATPPYWETTILAPGFTGDEVFLDGLPVGSVFSFVWNAMISMSFQIPGFLLTYLLHSTHAAKNGSRAGLGLTLVQKGFEFKFSSSSSAVSDPPSDFSTPTDGAGVGGVPSDPNSHDFDPSSITGGGASGGGGGGGGGVAEGISNGDLLAYALMIVGWFILIKSISDFVRARRHEQLVLQSPERALGVVPVVAEGEGPERTV